MSDTFKDLPEWEGSVDLVATAFYADYAGCGSHKIALQVRMDYRDMKSLQDQLTQILDETVESDWGGLLVRKSDEQT